MRRGGLPMTGIDDAIQQVERLYRTVTGKDAPATEPPYATIPPESDPTRYVEEQVERLMTALGQLPGTTPRMPTWTPPLSVWENAREIAICIELPGVPR